MVIRNKLQGEQLSYYISTTAQFLKQKSLNEFDRFKANNNIIIFIKIS